MSELEVASSRRSQDSRICHTWPQPVAALWQHMLEAEDHAGRARGLIDVNAAFLRLLWSYVAADHMANDLSAAALIGKNGLNPERATPDGTWVRLIDDALRKRSVSEDTTIAPLVSWWQNTRIGRRPTRPVLEKLVGHRNQLVHELQGETRVQREQVRAFEHETRELFATADWMSNLAVFHVLDTRVETHHTSGRLRWFVGVNASVVSSTRSKWNGRLIQDSAYLINTRCPTFAIQIDPLLFLGWQEAEQTASILLLADLQGRKSTAHVDFSASHSRLTLPASRTVDGPKVTTTDLAAQLSRTEAVRCVKLTLLSPLPNPRQAFKQVIDRFAVKEALGHGGMATVFRAYDQVLQSFVALKLLSEDGARDTTIRRRFIRETKQLQQLSHRHLMPIFQDGEAVGVDGLRRPFYTMPIAEGSLEDRYNTGDFDLKTLQQWASSAIAGLQALHKAGLIHRDIKPRNLLIVDGRLVIADLGVVRDTHDVTLATRTECVGTDGFIAPEVVTGMAATPAADIYGLGMTLHRGLRLCTDHVPNPKRGSARPADSLSSEQSGTRGPDRKAMKALIASMIAHDVSTRPSLADALSVLTASPTHRNAARRPTPSDEETIQATSPPSQDDGTSAAAASARSSSDKPRSVRWSLDVVRANKAKREGKRLMSVLKQHGALPNGKKIQRSIPIVLKRHGESLSRAELLRAEGDRVLSEITALAETPTTTRWRTPFKKHPKSPEARLQMGQLSGGALLTSVRRLTEYQLLAAAVWGRDPRDRARVAELGAVWVSASRQSARSLIDSLESLELDVPPDPPVSADAGVSTRTLVHNTARIAGTVSMAARVAGIAAVPMSAIVLAPAAVAALNTDTVKSLIRSSAPKSHWLVSDAVCLVETVIAFYRPST